MKTVLPRDRTASSRMASRCLGALACILSCGLALAPGAAAADAPQEPWNADDRRLEQSLTAHIGFLADDRLEGRGAGTVGHEIAARYVAAQFGQLGLQPGGDSQTWFQSVPLLESRLVPDSARLEIRSASQTNVLEYHLDFLALPHFLETNISVRAPLVFAGYGVQAPELGYDDFAGVDLRGCIAVVLAKAPPRFPATALAHHAHAREKGRKLAAHGAIGVITLPTPKDLEESPWPRRVNQARFPSMRWIGPDGTPADVVAQSKVSLSISPRGISAVLARSPKPLAEILAAAARSEPQSFPLQVEAIVTTRSEHRRLASPNVVGILPGSDPALRAQSIVFTAHLDHLGRGPAINGDAIYNGAFDNAIGVAMMLETARLAVSWEKRPRRTLVFAAVTAEEKGLVGSDYLAQHRPETVPAPVANLNLDMVLVTAPTRRFTVLGIEHSTLREPVEAAARRLGLSLEPDPQPERVTFVRSDQYSFVRQGVPAIFPKVFNAPGGSTGSTSVPAAGLSPEVFSKLHYHQPSDDLTLPRDAGASVRFVRFLTDVAQQVAQADNAPRWNAGDFFGRTFGRERP